MTEIETPRQTPERLPVFVYGTLRSNQPNWDWCLQNKTESTRRAVLHGGRMHDFGPFPYVIATGNPEDVVVGELMEIREGLYERVTHSLDALEGYFGEGSPRNHYDKRVVTVVTEDGVEHQAHTYVVPDRHVARIGKFAHVESGDWVAHDRARPAETALFMR